MKRKKSKIKPPSIYVIFAQKVVLIYVLIMVGLHPIFYQNHFFGMVSAKTKLFWVTTCILFVVLLINQSCKLIFNKEKEHKWELKKTFSHWSITDVCVLVFFVSILLSWLCSDYKAEAFLGAEGWFVGSATLLLCCVSYYCIASHFTYSSWVLWCMLVVNFFIFTIGIMNHFHMDPLGMFTILGEDSWAIFITTIGNINLYASYLCVIIPLFMVLFCFCKTTKSAIIYGGFLGLGFMNVIVDNSDSVYLGVGAAFVFLLWFVRASWTLLKRYTSLVLLFLVAAQTVGVMQMLFEEQALALAKISNFFARSTMILALLPVILLFLAMTVWMEKRQTKVVILSRTIKGLFGCGIVLAIGTIIMVFWINTQEVQTLNGWMSPMKVTDSWGSNRGFIWRYCIKLYSEYPLLHMLFGCGPDSLAYAMRDTYHAEMVEYLNAVFLNAHNEWIQFLLTLGVVGAGAYLTMLISACTRFVRASKDNPLLLAIAAMLVSYLAQGAVNNPQYITTPLLFILLGVGEAIVRLKFKEERECK